MNAHSPDVEAAPVVPDPARRLAQLIAHDHYANPNRGHCACGWRATVDARRFEPGFRHVSEQYEDHLTVVIDALMNPDHTHDWSERGSGDDRWLECWLCGVTADRPDGWVRPATESATTTEATGV